MKRLSLALLALLLSIGLYASAEITATPIRQEPLPLMGVCSIPRDGGGFIFAGAMPWQPDAQDDMRIGAVYQVDENGAELWRLEWTAGFSIFFRDMVPLSDGSIAVLCTTEDDVTGEGRADAVLIIRDGEQLADIELTPGNDAIWITMHPAREGFFVFSGERTEKDRHGGTFHVPVLEKRRNDGSVEWRHVFDEHELHLSSVMEVDGGYLFYGVVEEQKTGKRLNEGVAVRITEDGTVQWVAQVGDKNGGINFSGAALTNDGGVLLTGGYLPTKQPRIGLLTSPVTACLDLDGTLRWQRIYDDMGVETSSFTALAATENGFLTIWDEIDYMPPLHLVQLDASGEILDTLTLDSEAARASSRVWLEQTAGKTRLVFVEQQTDEAGISSTVRMLHTMEIGVR